MGGLTGRNGPFEASDVTHVLVKGLMVYGFYFYISFWVEYLIYLFLIGAFLVGDCRERSYFGYYQGLF